VTELENLMKKILIVAALAAFSPSCAFAEEAKVSKAVESIKTWFTHWGQALKRSAVESRYRKVRTTSVAAVRGAGQGDEDPSLPYWKGTWSEKLEKERIAERKELEGAVELALAGDLDGAWAKLDAFEKSHPKSSLLADIQEARAQLAAMKKELAPAAPEEAKPAETPPAEAAPAEAAKPEPVPEAPKEAAPAAAE